MAKNNCSCHSGLMMLSVLTFATNIGMTLRGSWKEIMSNVPLTVHRFWVYLLHIRLDTGNLPSIKRHEYLPALFTMDRDALSLSTVFSFGHHYYGYNVLGNPKSSQIKALQQETHGCNLVGFTVGFVIFMLGMMLAGLVANANWFTHQTIAQALPTLSPTLSFVQSVEA